MNVVVGHVYEWIRDTSSGRFLDKEERAESRFVVTGVGMAASAGSCPMWKTSEGTDCGVLFWLERGYLKLYSQHSLNFTTGHSISFQRDGFIPGRWIQLETTSGKKCYGIVMKVSGDIAKVRDRWSSDDFTIKHIRKQTYLLVDDAKTNYISSIVSDAENRT